VEDEGADTVVADASFADAECKADEDDVVEEDADPAEVFPIDDE
jgi:hypothetical protein